MSFPRIAIIGAGPSGLTLASILQKNGLQCAVFELDKDAQSRDQGGIVDLHRGAGQAALEEAGLLEAFKKCIAPSFETMKMIRKDGQVAWDENDTSENAPPELSKDRPEIDRSVLRDLLLSTVDPKSIQWNRKLVKVEAKESATAKYNLNFTDGVEEGFDLVVGADGAWSKVRPLVTNEPPFYAGVSIIELQAKQASETRPLLTNFVGKGSCFMFDEGRVLLCQQNGNDSVRIYAGVRQPETWVEECGIDWTKPETARRIYAEQYFGDCHEDIKRVIAEEGSDALIPRKAYMLPVGLRWETRPGIAVIGDAAHLMTPFGGVGVNVAMTDSMNLAKALVKRTDDFATDPQGSLDAAVKEYEEEMFVRAKKNAEKTYKGLIGHFSADGVDRFVEKFQQIAKMIEEEKQQLKA
ncbi:hypothetical protein BJ875DRAFT_166940 [Amylocarpus encephaloides]|uniref:FAD-binding domain-containing protein n=1 Tax=Amylocarpus encephaloides TaxID=45428 RepID=A0A9P8C1P6_9HELO|nr:hypothetical protein BJ875DRAFT_166940 [Amylocarpus encephaloides]